MLHSTSLDIRFVSVDEDHQKTVVDSNPGYLEFTLPAGTYRGQNEDFHTVTSNAAMLCNSNMEDGVAYWITKTIAENLKDIQMANSWLSEVTVESMSETGRIEMHSGAKEYFEEVLGN